MAVVHERAAFPQVLTRANYVHLHRYSCRAKRFHDWRRGGVNDGIDRNRKIPGQTRRREIENHVLQSPERARGEVVADQGAAVPVPGGSLDRACRPASHDQRVERSLASTLEFTDKVTDFTRLRL